MECSGNLFNLNVHLSNNDDGSTVTSITDIDTTSDQNSSNRLTINNLLELNGYPLSNNIIEDNDNRVKPDVINFINQESDDTTCFSEENNLILGQCIITKSCVDGTTTLDMNCIDQVINTEDIQTSGSIPDNINQMISTGAGGYAVCERGYVAEGSYVFNERENYSKDMIYAPYVSADGGYQWIQEVGDGSSQWTGECVLQQCPPLAVIDSDREFDVLTGDIESDPYFINCNDGYIFNSGEVLSQRGSIYCDYDRETDVLSGNVSWFVHNPEMKEYCESKSTREECIATPSENDITGVGEYCTWYGNIDSLDLHTNPGSTQELSNTIQGECLYRKPVVNNDEEPICAPRYCSRLPVANSNRGINNPLPGPPEERIHGLCLDPESEEIQDVYGNVMTSSADCGCQKHRSCGSCTQDQGCQWCGADDDDITALGGPQCFSVLTENPMCDSNVRSHNRGGTCVYALDSESNRVKEDFDPLTDSRSDCESNTCVSNQTGLPIPNALSDFIVSFSNENGTPYTNETMCMDEWNNQWNSEGQRHIDGECVFINDRTFNVSNSRLNINSYAELSDVDGVERGKISINEYICAAKQPGEIIQQGQEQCVNQNGETDSACTLGTNTIASIRSYMNNNPDASYQDAPNAESSGVSDPSGTCALYTSSGSETSQCIYQGPVEMNSTQVCNTYSNPSECVSDENCSLIQNDLKDRQFAWTTNVSGRYNDKVRFVSDNAQSNICYYCEDNTNTNFNIISGDSSLDGFTCNPMESNDNSNKLFDVYKQYNDNGILYIRDTESEKDVYVNESSINTCKLVIDDSNTFKTDINNCNTLNDSDTDDFSCFGGVSYCEESNCLPFVPTYNLDNGDVVCEGVAGVCADLSQRICKTSDTSSINNIDNAEVNCRLETSGSGEESIDSEQCNTPPINCDSSNYFTRPSPPDSLLSDFSIPNTLKPFMLVDFDVNEDFSNFQRGSQEYQISPQKYMCDRMNEEFVHYGNYCERGDEKLPIKQLCQASGNIWQYDGNYTGSWKCYFQEVDGISFGLDDLSNYQEIPDEQICAYISTGEGDSYTLSEDKECIVEGSEIDSTFNELNSSYCLNYENYDSKFEYQTNSEEVGSGSCIPGSTRPNQTQANNLGVRSIQEIEQSVDEISCEYDNHTFAQEYIYNEDNTCDLTEENTLQDISTLWTGGNTTNESSDCSASILSSCNVECDTGYGGGGDYICHYTPVDVDCSQISEQEGCDDNMHCMWTETMNIDGEMEGSCVRDPTIQVGGKLEWQGSECYLLNNDSFAHGILNLPRLNELFPPLMRIIAFLFIMLIVLYVLIYAGPQRKGVLPRVIPKLIEMVINVIFGVIGRFFNILMDIFNLAMSFFNVSKLRKYIETFLSAPFSLFKILMFIFKFGGILEPLLNGIPILKNIFVKFVLYIIIWISLLVFASIELDDEEDEDDGGGFFDDFTEENFTKHTTNILYKLKDLTYGKLRGLLDI